ncbi:hypothetical protein ASPZODRAFT_145852 [Penicilliopsis zonata CBS 506.65]|uniref:Uncharacterized protein n=1 Tax=Penicilliopsis zonata CBS 506.65 TaxID=1073090 RepID=A0A1L9S8L1_9EURO|nr:hypothetical protein ASPZODRAFT_145852 [Penicilliopsis zonata CBS 506.65]OJJ43498.1 hypothetical protein ASPZODRAFT_145852 [Penicilliopsis zonata CBS 506.65]
MDSASAIPQPKEHVKEEAYTKSKVFGWVLPRQISSLADEGTWTNIDANFTPIKRRTCSSMTVLGLWFSDALNAQGGKAPVPYDCNYMYAFVSGPFIYSILSKVFPAKNTLIAGTNYKDPAILDSVENHEAHKVFAEIEEKGPLTCTENLSSEGLVQKWYGRFYFIQGIPGAPGQNKYGDPNSAQFLGELRLKSVRLSRSIFMVSGK